MSITPDQFKKALASWASGVAVILIPEEDALKGITISAFMSGSLDPPLVIFAINRDASILPILRRTVHFGLSILNSDQAEDSTYWAGWSDKPGHEVQEWNKVHVIEGAHASFKLSHYGEHDGGDHLIFVARVEDCIVEETVKPLIYYKGKYRAIVHEE